METQPVSIRQSTPVEVTDVNLEAERLEEVWRYEILDTPPDGAFDRITELAARLFDVPISIVSIVDTDRIWFKSRHGIDAEETSRDPGLCASAILSDGPYIVGDALADPRTLANPLVTGALGLRFYAAQPLITGGGHRLGTLCIIDKEPRELGDDELATLQTLAAIVMDALELRLSAHRVVGLLEERRKATESEAEHHKNIAERLHEGMESNRQIGKALGLIMAQYKVDEHSAFNKLRDHSNDLNIKLREIAAELVEHHNRGYPSAAHPLTDTGIKDTKQPTNSIARP